MLNKVGLRSACLGVLGTSVNVSMAKGSGGAFLFELLGSIGLPGVRRCTLLGITSECLSGDSGSLSGIFSSVVAGRFDVTRLKSLVCVFSSGGGSSVVVGVADNISDMVLTRGSVCGKLSVGAAYSYYNIKVLPGSVVGKVSRALGLVGRNLKGVCRGGARPFAGLLCVATGLLTGPLDKLKSLKVGVFAAVTLVRAKKAACEGRVVREGR